MNEIEQVKGSLVTGDPRSLPATGQKIWARMFESAKRWYRGPEPEKYSRALAWRAIKQKYGMPLNQAEKRLAVRQPSTKSFGTQVSSMEGGAYIVALGDNNREGFESRYERVEPMSLKGSPGVVIRVGISPLNHRNIIDIKVPASLVSQKLGGAGARSWVHTNWRNIWYTAKDMLRADEKRTPVSSNMKFVTDPALAKERIGYGEALTPWEVDFQGEYATEKEVKAIAHNFVRNLPKAISRIGEMHNRFGLADGQVPGEVVESSIIGPGNKYFTEGAWVLGVKFHPEVWKKVLSGEYRGFSIGGRWGKAPVQLAS